MVADGRVRVHNEHTCACVSRVIDTILKSGYTNARTTCTAGRNSFSAAHKLSIDRYEEAHTMLSAVHIHERA
eukprot:2664-Heterococcus_DN1.PRE.3